MDSLDRLLSIKATICWGHPPETVTDQNNKSKEIELAKNQKELFNLKSKIENQLKIINDLFSDPESIHKIEDYNIPFAKGNFDNLKKLSSLLLENKRG